MESELTHVLPVSRLIVIVPYSKSAAAPPGSTSIDVSELLLPVEAPVYQFEALIYPVDCVEPEPKRTPLIEVPVVLTPLNITVMRLTQLGILLNVMLVPLVLATDVPEVITLDAIELTTAPVIVGLVSVLLVSVCVASVPTSVVVAVGNVAV